MKLITFDALRTLGLPRARYIKPERMYDHLDEIRAADWLLFPEYWQINTLLYGLNKRIFPSPASYYLGHNKVEQTRAFMAVCPEHLPKTAIHGSSRYALQAVLENFSLPLVAKAVKSARGEGVALLNTEAELFDWAANHDVLYVQEKLDINRDLRVVWVGGRCLDAYWRIAPEGGFLNNVSQGGSTSRDDVPQAALDLVARIANQLQIDHGGFDVAMVDDWPYLFEFNRLFGNQGLAGGTAVWAEAVLARLSSQ
ncbi:ATP-grasp domain-containing protein [Marinospirillum alkaliphilum]|uniref:Ribosomal protein S6--L-glutamate ligase n=1 Tax=Marinospirillum alkaliphilum DSM 21637 TaxID=1122209 RepID=A0A1K1WNN0_9GAMM|nr:alpha-L-glutamate ligase [Marinospirillum alkaliphilum]SFX38572.1 ribosomal protein S6--L-glutamate ligase [Marinospirillum alkaliphilum DSM 21637]